MVQSYCSGYFQPKREETLKKKNEGSLSDGELRRLSPSTLCLKTNVEAMINSLVILE